MNTFPDKLLKKLLNRKENNSFRELSSISGLIDFSSNDYLGFSKLEGIFKRASILLKDESTIINGATGSRLLSGNHKLYNITEKYLCEFHKSEAALIFNSGYDANIGFFSSVPQRGDIILYDEFIHASIRDGIKMSNAKAYKFKHNDIVDLNNYIERSRKITGNANEIYIVTESVFSMDGDTPDFKSLIKLCQKNGLHLIVDEAHSVGVFGEKGCGIIQSLDLQSEVFARIITFGKALGCHGAAILGSSELKKYLMNFARSFIYTTALPPHSLATILASYEQLNDPILTNGLNENIKYFNLQLEKLKLKKLFIRSNSAIHCCIISGNTKVKEIALQLKISGFDVKPILSPTVPEGQERFRFCLHSYNTQKEISEVLKLLAIFV